MSNRRVPPNVFAIPFGLAGLSEAWQQAQRTLHTPAAVPDAIAIVAALAWLALIAAYASQGAGQALADLRDRTLSPFLPLVPITGMLLATTLAGQGALAAGKALVVTFLIVTLVAGGLLTGEWIVAPLDHDTAHPGYFLPTVAGGLVAAACASQVGMTAVAQGAFGIGMTCWALLGSTILNRLFFHAPLPAPLLPTLAIELAPPSVAGLAYFALSGGRTDLVSRALAGYAILMILVQARMLPRFARLKFAAGFWAFTFSWAATCAYALAWIAIRKPPGATAYATVIIAVITAFIGYIAARTVPLILRGQLLPRPEVISAPNETVAAAAISPSR